jgi:acyl-CoA synthetase (AMP-forming)/AMP-acid ligase II
LSRASTVSGPSNIAVHLGAMARRQPHTLAVVVPAGRDRSGRVRYTHLTYLQLDRDSDRIARGLDAMGIARGARAVVMVRPGLDFFALVFAVFKAGVVPVLIDPGIGLGSLGRCCRDAAPEVFIGIPKAVWAHRLLGWGRETVRQVILVAPGRRRLGRSAVKTLDEVREAGRGAQARGLDATPVGDPPSADEVAAILFTSGSTGPPKGAVYTHGTLNAQVELIRDLFAIEPGEVDLCTFPLFALFAPALGMTAIVPDMDPTRPARADPAKIVEAIEDFGATNLFGSPALLRQLVRGDDGALAKLPSLKRVVSAGAPIAAQTLERMARRLEPPAQVHPTYGATEALPVASIGSEEALGQTRRLTEMGQGVCVGMPVEGLEARIIRIDDGPIPTWSDDLVVPEGTIGEIVVAGPVVTRSYFNRPEATGLAKIADRERSIVYHRMGDVGYRDDLGRLWFCGRKSHRVILPDVTLFTIPCEAIFITHPAVERSALVGVRRGRETVPVICIEAVGPLSRGDRERIRRELLERGAGFAHTRPIRTILFHPRFPVDIRHNSKIFREQLAVWAARRLP